MNHKLKPSDIGSYRKNYMTSWNWFFSSYCNSEKRLANSYWYFKELNYAINYPEFIKYNTITSKLIRTLYEKL